MKSFSLQSTPAKFESDLQNLKGQDIQLVLLFTSTENFKKENLPAKVKTALPGCHLLGCSTSGEIGDRIDDDTITLLGIKFEKTKFKCVAVPVKSAEDSREAGRKLAEQLVGDDLASVFVLMPGLNVNGSKFTLGLKEILPSNVSVSGGLAGDGLRFKETLTVFENDISSSQAVAFGLYGKDVRVQAGSRGGWKPFGPQRRVTKAEGNILYEIDGKPALALYKEYLGDKAADLPSSGLLYPFAIMDAQNNDAVGLIRTILDINEAENSLILAGDLDVGQLVCLMHANTDELVDGAEEAAKIALGSNVSTSDDAVICISCVGRKIVMGDDTEDELDAVRGVFKSSRHIAGFHSYGEICIFQDTGEPELHNQTMTITYIAEA